jgi:hypothetical protein
MPLTLPDLDRRGAWRLEVRQGESRHGWRRGAVRPTGAAREPPLELGAAGARGALALFTHLHSHNFPKNCGLEDATVLKRPSADD